MKINEVVGKQTDVWLMETRKTRGVTNALPNYGGWGGGG